MTSRIESLLRSHIAGLVPYSCARDEFTGEASVYLDANESPFGSPAGDGLNRYPDPLQKKIKARLGTLYDIDPSEIFIGNGSDEVIDLLVKAFCEPGQDSVVICPPTYGMYAVSAETAAVGVRRVGLLPDFSLDVDALQRIRDRECKILFIGSPNNPTANAFAPEVIGSVAASFPGIVVVDEAYGEFSPYASARTLLAAHDNIVVVKTLSKAWGLAGLRVGIAFAHRAVIHALNKVKPPYNVNVVSQRLALKALEGWKETQARVTLIARERDRLMSELAALPQVKKVHPSVTNFLLVEFDDPNRWQQQLLRHGVVVRNRSREPLCAGCLRITIGTPEENDYLLAVLQGTERAFGAARRLAVVSRHTNETNIQISLSLDGKGRAEIATGLGFLDHMLHLFTRHSGVDLTLRAVGDLEVDEHHTIEDIALALGEALTRALGEKRGIRRYAFWLPMDEADARVTVDFSGRSLLVWSVPFHAERVGDFPLQMAEHFFRSFADTAKLNLHVEARGDNDHHILEAVFKAVGRAVGEAVKEQGGFEVPSTKGML